MAISEQQRPENQSYRLGERDPHRPPGLMLVVVAFALLVAFGYVIFPGKSPQPSPPVSGGGPSANTNPAQSPTGK